MKTETGIKELVKALPITRPGQKIHFTVRHPENALFLTGIAVTGTKILNPDDTRAGDNTGVLSLAIAEEGDVFYTEEIKSERGRAEGRIQGSFKKRFGFSGKRFEYFDTCKKITDASLEGFYEDAGSGPTGPPHDSDVIVIPLRPLYKITLYLRYQMKEEKQTA